MKASSSPLVMLCQETGNPCGLMLTKSKVGAVSFEAARVDPGIVFWPCSCKTVQPVLYDL